MFSISLNPRDASYIRACYTPSVFLSHILTIGIMHFAKQNIYT